jgi:galactitol-specific phosphotransferase system IIB component
MSIKHKCGGSISTREMIQSAIDRTLKDLQIDDTLTTAQIYDRVSHKTRTITTRNVALQMRERYDLKWTGPGKWIKTALPDELKNMVVSAKNVSVST